MSRLFSNSALCLLLALSAACTYHKEKIPSDLISSSALTDVPSFESLNEKVLAKQCTECHIAKNLFNPSDYSQLKANLYATRVKVLRRDFKPMPPDSALSPEDTRLLVGWIDAGAPLEKPAKGSPPPAPAPEKAPDNVKDIMAVVVDPAMDIVWDSFGATTDETGDHEYSPQTEEEWNKVIQAAKTVIEGSKMLLAPGLHAAPAGTKSTIPEYELTPEQIDALLKTNRKEFDKSAQEMMDLGAEILKALETKDREKILDLGEKMDPVCERCHQVFWNPPGGPPKLSRRSPFSNSLFGRFCQALKGRAPSAVADFCKAHR